jgi:hypothetical protein
MATFQEIYNRVFHYKEDMDTKIMKELADRTAPSVYGRMDQKKEIRRLVHKIILDKELDMEAASNAMIYCEESIKILYEY